MRKLVPLILLIGVSIVLGCTMPGGETTTIGVSNGIIITDFSFDYSPIYAGDQIGLNIELQNVGGEEGTLDTITVFGQDLAGSPDPLRWSTTDPETVSPGELLYPPDPVTGAEGDFYTEQWLLNAPTGVRAPTNYDFQVRSEYTYDTVYTGTIRIIESNYLRTISAEERDALIKQGGVVSSSVTGGPLIISAASGRHFIVQEGAGADTKTIKFKITNVGSGNPYGGTITPDNLYVVTVTGTEGFVTGTCDPDTTLARGKTGVIKCDIAIPAEASFTNKQDRNFQLTLTYQYYIDSAAQITINPTYD